MKNSNSLSSLERFSKLDRLRACVVGLGRIGLPISAKLANSGVNTRGYDIDPNVILQIRNGHSLRDEPGVTQVVLQAIKGQMLSFTDKIDIAMSDVDVVIICVPTPINELNSPDYSAINSCCIELSTHLRKGMLIIVESTVGIGTVENLIRPILESRSRLKAGYKGFLLAACPERVDPGRIIRNLETVPRVIGGIDEQSTEAAAIFYSTVFGVPIIKVSTPRTANATKLIENVFRDVNIALVNELTLFLKESDVDLIEAITAAETKWNFVPHYPGPGVGGPCIPVSPYYLLSDGVSRTKSLPRLLKTAREINSSMPSYVVSMVFDRLDQIKTNPRKKIAVLGIAYKPNIKCVKNSPSEFILKELGKREDRIAVYDPLFKGETFAGFKIKGRIEDAVRNADCLLVLTAHSEFRTKEFKKVLQLLHPQSTIIDAANVFEPSEIINMGFKFKGLAR